MIAASIERLLAGPTAETARAFLADEAAVFWVDWREEDDAIARYCEAVLKTGSLSGEFVEIDDDPGFEIWVSYRERRIKVPIVVGVADRHLTVLTLNRVLAPDYEIRACADSRGSDSVAFAALATAEWSALEKRFGAEVARRFVMVCEQPNLFTERW